MDEGEEGQGSTKFRLLGLKSRTNCNFMDKSLLKSILISKSQAKDDQEECLIQTQTDTHKLSVTQTICDRRKNSVTYTDFLWKTQIVCDSYILSLTDTDCL